MMERTTAEQTEGEKRQATPEAGAGQTVHRLHCREIWGGNAAADTGVATPQLDGWLYSEPFQTSAGGGDIYYVSLCGKAMIVRLIVADMSGHGATVAEQATKLKQLMDQNINNVDQSELIRAVNLEFTRLSRRGHFATAVVATYFAADASLVTCNAGHPRPLWYRAADGTWHLLHGESPHCKRCMEGLPLGLLAESGYQQFSVGLGRGDMVLVYTDALIEARSPGGELLGEEGLVRLAAEVPIGPPAQMTRAMLKALGAYRGGTPAEDDLTLLLLYHHAENRVA